MTVICTSNLTKVFVSYSHRDWEHLERLQTHLAPHVRGGEIELWDDTKIKPGSPWREEIDRAINSARVAILLVSADFLASDFIHQNELPPLLAAAKQRGVTILPVILGYSSFHDTELEQYQTVNPPSKPLSGMSLPEREKVWMQVAELVKSAGTVDIAEKIEEVSEETVHPSWDPAPLVDCLSTLATNQLYSLFRFLTVGQAISVSRNKRTLLVEIRKIIDDDLSVVSKLYRFAKAFELTHVLEYLLDNYESEVG